MPNMTRKQRRKLNRRARKAGVYHMICKDAEIKAQSEVKIRVVLAAQVCGGDKTLAQAARKEQKRLQTIKSHERSGLDGFWNPTQLRYALG